MISQKYKDMLGQKSVIREMSAAGHKMGEEIGFDNVFDYSLGNPSVPAPKKVEAVIKSCWRKQSRFLCTVIAKGTVFCRCVKR